MSQQPAKMLGEDVLMLLGILYMLFEQVDSRTRVSLTAPVNPVRTGNMFAICCQVWDLRQGHDVLIARSKSGITEKISLSNGQLLDDVDERFFLAKRRKNDGSIIYFLSIVNAQLDDDALYSCKVYGLQETFEEIAQESQHIEVQYFPHSRYPLCASTPDEPIDVYEGKPIALTCRSEFGNPMIQIRWRRAGNTELMKGLESARSGILYSVIRKQVAESDNGAIFVCELTSPAFYSKTEVCQIGPITVIPVPKVSTPSIETTPMIVPDPYHGGTTMATPFIHVPDVLDNHCLDRCDEQQALLFYWTIAAVISFVLCLVFLIMSVVLCCKVTTITARPRTARGVAPGVVQNYVPPRNNPETVYVKLQRNSNSDRVYMTLEGYDVPENRVLLPREIYDKYYQRSTSLWIIIPFN